MKSGIAFAVLLTLLFLTSCSEDGGNEKPQNITDDLAADSDGSSPAKLTVDRIFHDKEFEIDEPVQKKWLDDGDAYTTLEASPTLEGAKDIVRYDAASGERSILVSAEHFVQPDSDEPLAIEHYAWSENGKFLLIQTNAVRFRRYKSLGDYWILNLENNTLRKVGAFAEPSALLHATFSPDSGAIAYVYKHNIYVEPAEGGEPRQLTRDGSDLIVNGMADWVNEEEFSLLRGYRWSPDGRRIAFWRFDTTGVGAFYMMKNTGGVYSQPVALQYPKAGTTNSEARIGVVDLRSGNAVWMDIPGDPRQNYVPYMAWADNSQELLIQRMNRLQNTNQVFLGDASNGSVEPIFVDRDDAWVDVNFDVKWLLEGGYFTWLSERDGWRRLYRVSRDGEDISLLTPGDFDVLKIVEIDAENGWAYYIASPDNPTERYLFRSPLFGEPRVERLTPVSASGTHAYDIAPNAKFAFHTSSTFGAPPTTDVISLPEHAALQTMVTNTASKKRLQTISRGTVEFFKVDIPDGVALDGWMMKPPDFDPSKKYPLLMYVYSEPAGQTVLNQWGRSDRYLWHLMMTQKGYVVASVDSRGTPAPKGRAWRKSIYRQIGILASADQANAVKTLIAERPYLDADRVGSWGWSGGGQMTLNALFRYPDLYKAGVAIAFVSDQRLYDTIYQERFMGLPSENEEGYRLGSPITFADRLKGDLLIMHGTADDNVHYQNTEQLIEKLVAFDKDFSLMIYPDHAHALDDTPNSKRHVYRTMQNFILDRLPPGPRDIK